MPSAQQVLPAQEKIIILFVECYKRGSITIKEATEFLGTTRLTAKRLMQRIYDVTDRSVFNVDFIRDETTIFSPDVCMQITDNN